MSILAYLDNMLPRHQPPAPVAPAPAPASTPAPAAVPAAPDASVLTQEVRDVIAHNKEKALARRAACVAAELKDLHNRDALEEDAYRTHESWNAVRDEVVSAQEWLTEQSSTNDQGKNPCENGAASGGGPAGGATWGADPAVSAGAGSMSSAGTSENRNASKKNVKRIADKMRQDTRHPDNPPDEFDKCSEEYLTSVPFWERFTHYLSNEYLINAPGKDNHGFDSMDGADWRQWQNWRRLFESYAAQRSWWF